VTRYVALAEYFWLAEQVTGVDADTLAKASRSDLADSALEAPRAGIGNVEFYPDVYDRAAVLVCRLAWNHPLPDGNKRAAWAALVMFTHLNEGTWEPDAPDIDQAEEAMLAIAAGEVDETWTAACSKNAFGSSADAERTSEKTGARRTQDGSQPSEGQQALFPPNLLGRNCSVARPEGLEPPTF
jgi:death-on-curing protein